jgi:hypothetical protein
VQDEERDLMEGRLLMLLEIATQPPRREAAVTMGLLTGDESCQLERLHEADLPDLPRRRLGNEQVVILERALEDGARVALRGRVPSSRGRDGSPSLERKSRSAN